MNKQRVVLGLNASYLSCSLLVGEIVWVNARIFTQWPHAPLGYSPGLLPQHDPIVWSLQAPLSTPCPSCWACRASSDKTALPAGLIGCTMQPLCWSLNPKPVMEVHSLFSWTRWLRNELASWPSIDMASDHAIFCLFSTSAVLDSFIRGERRSMKSGSGCFGR